MILTARNPLGVLTLESLASRAFQNCADSTIDWQYAAAPIIAGGAYTSIVIELAYDYNANTALFDGIQE